MLSTAQAGASGLRDIALPLSLIDKLIKTESAIFIFLVILLIFTYVSDSQNKDKIKKGEHRSKKAAAHNILQPDTPKGMGQDTQVCSTDLSAVISGGEPTAVDSVDGQHLILIIHNSNYELIIKNKLK